MGLEAGLWVTYRTGACRSVNADAILSYGPREELLDGGLCHSSTLPRHHLQLDLRLLVCGGIGVDLVLGANKELLDASLSLLLSHLRQLFRLHPDRNLRDCGIVHALLGDPKELVNSRLSTQTGDPSRQFSFGFFVPLGLLESFVGLDEVIDLALQGSGVFSGKMRLTLEELAVVDLGRHFLVLVGPKALRMHP
jgi:hypothetical protein